MVGVLVLSDVQVFREGLAIALSRSGQFDVAQAASRPREALRIIARKSPRVALVDLSMADSFCTISEIARHAPHVQQVALAVENDPQQIIACAEAGAAGFLSRDASLTDLIQAIRNAETGTLRCDPAVTHMLFCHVGKMSANGYVNGSGKLTRREKEILDLIERGHSNKIIARDLGIEVSTVKNHVHSLLAKLGVRRRGEAAALHRRRIP